MTDTTSPKSPDDDLRALAERFLARIAGWDRTSDKGRVTIPLSELRAARTLLNDRDALRERLAEAERQRDAARSREALALEQAAAHLDRWGEAERRAETAEAALRMVREHGSVMARLEPDAHDAVITALALSERTP